MSDNYCLTDLLGKVKILPELWWLDIFMTMTVIGIFILLVVGTYFLIADLSREENQGTFNFIRLSPQTAQNILLGKILGVPILIYWVGLCAIPFHLFAGILANIPLSLILLFYVVLIFSCGFFYSGAILLSFAASKVNSFQAFLSAGVLLVYLLITYIGIFHQNIATHSSLDWLVMFNPIISLFYLVKSTFLSSEAVDYLRWEYLSDLRWYGQSFRYDITTGIGFILLNYTIFTYWLWQGVKRRFNQPLATIWTKKQSYLITLCFVIFNLGFTLQKLESPLQNSNNTHIYISWILFSFANLLLFLALIATITPQRQLIYDWANYRYSHGKPKLLSDLTFGENSPPIFAIVLNLGIVALYSLPAILLFNFQESILPVIAGLLLTFNLIIICSAITQMILMLKTSKRAILAVVAVGIVTISPLLVCAILGLQANSYGWLFMFTPLAMLGTKEALISTIIGSILSQWLIVAVANFGLQKQISSSVVKVLPTSVID